MITSFLLTRLCEARRTGQTGMLCLFLISTHAPLRGATRGRDHPLRRRRISTHAPLRGATSLPALEVWSDTDFYSRASARRDYEAAGIVTDRIHFYSRASARRDKFTTAHRCRHQISTHAPLRGATDKIRLTVETEPHFYSRASARRDGKIRL